MSGRRTFGGTAGGGRGGPKGNLRFQKNEPKFLRELKAQLGYKEAVPDISDKVCTGGWPF